MIRNTSSLGDILDEHLDLHLCKSGYSEDNILAESETVVCDLTVSPKDCQASFILAKKIVSSRQKRLAYKPGF